MLCSSEFKTQLSKLEEDLFLMYTTGDMPEDSGTSGEQKTDLEQEIMMARLNTEHVRDLIMEFIYPVIDKLNQETMLEKKRTKELCQLITQKSSNNHINTKVEKRRSAWAIFLSEKAKNLPGWKETTAKLTLASKEYEKLSPEQREQLIVDYYASRNMQIPEKTKNQRKPRLSGLDAFRKCWYQERKKNNPEAKGLDSQCTKDWATLTPKEKADWKEVRRQQLESQIKP